MDSERGTGYREGDGSIKHDDLFEEDITMALRSSDNPYAGTAHHDTPKPSSSPTVDDVFASMQDLGSGASEHIPVTLRRILKFVTISSAVFIVFIVATLGMMISHWTVPILGHFVLAYTVPYSIDTQFAERGVDTTVLFSELGALVVNLPSLIVFLCCFPGISIRAVRDGSLTPLTSFTKRIIPQNRYALVVVKYAPRIATGSVGRALYPIVFPGELPSYFMLDPLHAALAGIVGEMAFLCLDCFRKTGRKMWVARRRTVL